MGKYVATVLGVKWHSCPIREMMQLLVEAKDIEQARSLIIGATDLEVVSIEESEGE